MFRSASVLGILASAFAMSPGGMARVAPTPQAIVHKKSKRGLFSGAVLPSGEPLVGTRQSRRTVSMDKRAATKARNKQRNKKK